MDETAEVFDAVVASEVVEHVIDLELFIQCCYQVLKVRQNLPPPFFSFFLFYTTFLCATLAVLELSQ